MCFFSTASLWMVLSTISVYKGFVTNPKYPNEKVHRKYVNWLIHIIMLKLHDWLVVRGATMSEMIPSRA